MTNHIAVKGAQNSHVTNYWLRFYCAKHCTLCGNLGWIDTTGIKTPAGFEVGRKNWCICQNAQTRRKTAAKKARQSALQGNK